MNDRMDDEKMAFGQVDLMLKTALSKIQKLTGEHQLYQAVIQKLKSDIRSKDVEIQMWKTDYRTMLERKNSEIRILKENLVRTGIVTNFGEIILNTKNEEEDGSEARILGSQNYIHDNEDNIAEVLIYDKDLQVIKEEELEEEIVPVDPLEEPLEDIRLINSRDQHEELCIVKEEEPDPLADAASDGAQIVDVKPLIESPVNQRTLVENKKNLFNNVSVITGVVECNKHIDINYLNGSIKTNKALSTVTIAPINDTNQTHIKYGIKENKFRRKKNFKQKSEPNNAEIISDDDEDANQTCEMKEEVIEPKIESIPCELERDTITDPDDPPYSPHAKETRNNSRRRGPATKKGTLSSQACDVCEQVFPNQQEKKMHLKLTGHNTDDASKRFPCPICGRKFRVKEQMKRHVEQIHEDNKNYKCSRCDKAFNNEFSMRRHEANDAVHAAGPKPPRTLEDLNCPYCDKVFPSRKRSIYKYHIKAHLESPVPCELCGKEVAASYIDKHTKTCKKERDFACSYCSKKFCRKDLLTDHTRLHTGEKPYNCPICQMDFRTYEERQRHAKKLHAARSAAEFKQIIADFKEGKLITLTATPTGLQQIA